MVMFEQCGGIVFILLGFSATFFFFSKKKNIFCNLYSFYFLFFLLCLWQFNKGIIQQGNNRHWCNLVTATPPMSAKCGASTTTSVDTAPYSRVNRLSLIPNVSLKRDRIAGQKSWIADGRSNGERHHWFVNAVQSKYIRMRHSSHMRIGKKRIRHSLLHKKHAVCHAADLFD